MARLIVHAQQSSADAVSQRRRLEYLQLSPADRLAALLSLNAAARFMNGNKPLRQPQGKGIIIRKPSNRDL